ncbi:MAG: hypothetical protein IPG02_05525 [Ignavibacteria bacterium]|nr:hypothetical protein [Ignavibacteria bacterium]
MASNMTSSPSSQFIVTSTGTLNTNGNTFTITSGTLVMEAGATISGSWFGRTQNALAFNIAGEPSSMLTLISTQALQLHTTEREIRQFITEMFQLMLEPRSMAEVYQAQKHFITAV